MVDGETRVKDSEKTESNRMVIQSFVEVALIQGYVEKLDDYIDQNTM